MEHKIFGPIKKRGAIAGQHEVALKAADDLKADLDAIDRALVLCGYTNDPKPPFAAHASTKARPKRLGWLLCGRSYGYEPFTCGLCAQAATNTTCD